MNKKLASLSLVLVFALCVPSYGWGNVGHMAVAYVAYQKLTPRTRNRANALLKLNPQYETWVKMVPDGTSSAGRQRMIFMIAATWADQIKGLNQYHDDGSHGGNRPPDDPSAGQNIGYTDFARHKYWHFIDDGITQDGTAIQATPTPNAETQIDAFRKVLAGTDSDELKSYDLVWLLHLVGDIHQPLHCVNRFGQTQPDGDDGGNSVKICNPTCNGNLHSYWDDLPGAGKSPTDAVNYGKRLAQADAGLAAKLHTSDWIKESVQEAKSQVYKNPPVGLGAGPFTLTAAYKTAASRLSKQRVALAGARLANILNKELK